MIGALQTEHGQEPAISFRRRAGTIAGVGLVFLVLAWPVWRAGKVLDPLDDFYTDHLRYRYCAALTISSPVRALTTPLSVLFTEDPRAHKVMLWEAQPCHQPGVVFLAFHAPVQWLLDAELISEERATALQIVLLLALVHLAIGRMLLSRFWWAGVLVYPLVLRCALNGLQEPLPFLLALLGAFSWAKGQRLKGLTLVILAFSAYSRWLVWLVGFAWLCWRDRQAVREELRVHAGTWSGRLGLLAVSAVLGWSVFGNWLVSTVWVAAPSQLKWAEAALLLGYAGAWAVYGWRSRESQVAPVMLAALGFLLSYRGLIPYWYMVPLLPAVVLARRPGEKWLWAVAALVLPDALFHQGLFPAGLGALVRQGWLGP